MSLDKKLKIPQCLLALGRFFINRIVKKKYCCKRPILRSKCDLKNTHKEIPFYASFAHKGSYTIEAAIIIPLFITFMVFGMFFFRLLQVESGVQQSMNTASRTMAVTLGNFSNRGESDEDVNTDEEPTIGGELSEAALLAGTIALTGVQMIDNNVPVEFVDGGPLGFNFLGSTAEGNYIDLKVNYTMTFPVGLLGNLSYDVTQHAKTRKWVGYDKNENSTDGTYVYITDHGEAYHINYFCTYLNPSVHKVAKDEVKSKRNKSGHTYSVCARCRDKKPGSFLYITDYGTSFHNDVNCTEIKHNIKKVLYEEVKDTMRPCSKCSAGVHH